MRRSLKDLLAEYGTVALVVYFTIFFLTLAGFWIAIRAGYRPQSVTGSAGTAAAAYIATKLTQPLRILGTVALTPLVAKLWEKRAGRTVPRTDAR